MQREDDGPGELKWVSVKPVRVREAGYGYQAGALSSGQAGHLKRQRPEVSVMLR